MEDLIPVLIFFIIAAYSLFSKIMKAGRVGGGGGQLDKLRSWLAKMKKYAEDSQNFESEKKERLSAIPRPPSFLKPGSMKRQETPSQKSCITVPDQPESVKPKRTSVLGCQSRAHLRRAIIWSEILGPPIALRDSSESRR